MKNKLRILSLFILAALLSSFSKDDLTPLSNFKKDFPTSEKVEFKYLNKINLKPGKPARYFFVDKSVLWVMKETNDDFGSCYDLKTGKKLGVIAYKGAGLNQFYGIGKIVFDGDSVQFHSSQREIKIFAKKDIIEDKPLEKRKFSYMISPFAVQSAYMHKLPNGSVLATLGEGISYPCDLGGYAPGVSKREVIHRPTVSGVSPEFNKRSVAIFNSQKAASYETIDYNRFDYSTVKEYNISHEEKLSIVRSSYTLCHIGSKGNRAIFVSQYSPILYTFDLNTKKVIKEKIYTDIILSNETDKVRVRPYFSTLTLKYNEKYIICIVEGTEKKENLNRGIRDFLAVLVYDWDLNPVKRIDLKRKGDKVSHYRYFISEDCKSVYLSEITDKSLNISKADLGLK